MPRTARELSALEVGRLKASGLHAVGGVSGLHLQVMPSGARSWILRVMVGAKRRDMGLGGFPSVTLAQAREKARAAREQVELGTDPIVLREQARSALLATEAAARTFAQCVDGFMDAKSSEWRNDKHRQQWRNTLEQYAYPVIGEMLARDVELPHILRILEPIWSTKTETATRVRGRLEAVLAWATVRGYRTGENPARWRNHLDKLLAKPSKVAKVEHHQALAVDKMPAFMRALREREGVAALGLEFAILTAARSGEVRGATWAEIDLQRKVWTVPAARMKAGKEHRVPLSSDAIRILKAVPKRTDTDVVFAAPRGGALSDMSLTAVLRRMKVDAVPHGFRSTFRDWAAERTNYPRDMAEMALAHTISSKVEAAYRRGDMLAKREAMMTDWARFCAGVTARKVVPLKQAA